MTSHVTCMRAERLNIGWQQGMQSCGAQCCDPCAGLTPAGVLHSWLLGTAIYSAFGPGGYTIVCLYFLLGSAVCAHIPAQCITWLSTPHVPGSPSRSLVVQVTRVHAALEPSNTAVQVTKVKLAQKQKEGIAEARSGRRTIVSASHHPPLNGP